MEKILNLFPSNMRGEIKNILVKMDGIPQPVEFHPEGDVLAHTIIVVNKVIEAGGDLPTIFAALMHDVGKILTPEEMLPWHIGHDKQGAVLIQDLKNNPTNIPREWWDAAEFVALNHMRAHNVKKKNKILRLVIESNATIIGFKGFKLVVLADGDDRKPLGKLFEEDLKVSKQSYI